MMVFSQLCFDVAMIRSHAGCGCELSTSDNCNLSKWDYSYHVITPILPSFLYVVSFLGPY